MKYFSFNKRLNNFSRIGDNSGLIFLKTTCGFLSGSMTFLVSRLFISLETSRVEMNILIKLCSVCFVKLWRGWPLSSTVEFEAKIEAK